MIEISKLIEGLLVLIGIHAIYEIGYTMRFEHLKSDLSKEDFPDGKPHFKFHFWRIALFPNLAIDPRNNFLGLMFPSIKYEEHWVKVYGPLWWRTCSHEMQVDILSILNKAQVESMRTKDSDKN